MLLLAKIGAVAVLVWFYLSAQKQNQPPIKWAITGFIGYCIAWGLSYMIFTGMLPKAASRTTTMGFLVLQIPALCAIAAAYFIRQKLVHDTNPNASVDGE